ncbi:MAG: hypothetical protein ACYSUV_16505 [Planctomycetota bacterium]|jgi:hypothetical protein
MRRVAISSLTLCLLPSFGILWAEDRILPPWGRGSEGTTYQRWEFGDSNLNPPPEQDVYNPLGTPVMLISDAAVHLGSYLDMSGVWSLECPDDIYITIQNYNEDAPIKFIWIQVTYAAEEGAAPLVLTNPEYYTMVVSDPVLFGEHWYVTYDLVIEPCPPSEVVVIQPAGCRTYIDEIVIDTICTCSPLRATNPSPADGATGVGINVDLSWRAGPLATSHDVYFGSSITPELVRNETTTTYDPGTLDSNTTFYWRIDEVNADGTTTGVIWGFGTQVEPDPDLNNDGIVNFLDYAILGSYWMCGCSQASWCNGADLDWSGGVDFNDLRHVGGERPSPCRRRVAQRLRLE